MRTPQDPVYMKVTVCFDSVRVVVPCSDGTMTVADLVDKAVARFLKATGRSLSQWIHVQKLMTLSDGGILDPSDLLRDVVDDREQITAVFEEQSGSMLLHRGGDGTSASSTSASSPEMFHEDHVKKNDLETEYGNKINESDVIITTWDLMTGSGLRVRRGSEPALNMKELVNGSNSVVRAQQKGTRFHSGCYPYTIQEVDSILSAHTVERSSQSQETKTTAVLNNLPGSIYEDISMKDIIPQPSSSSHDSQENVRYHGQIGLAFHYNSSEELDRTLLAEGSDAPPPPVPPRMNLPSTLTLQKTIASGRTNTRLLGKQISLQLVKGPDGLGFSITTRDNPAGGNCPVYVKNIMLRGAAVESGQLLVGDRLLQVNGIELTGKSQSEVVKILRNLPEGSTVDLVVSRQDIFQTSSDQTQKTTSTDSVEQNDEIDCSPVSGVPVPEALCDSHTAAIDDLDILCLNICMNSDQIQGLGVTIKEKTVPMSSGLLDLGIFIKSVIPGGSAFKDGRLHVDDQLLEVNGECLVDRNNADATDLLRFAILKKNNIPGCVQVIVARKKDTSQLKHPLEPATTLSFTDENRERQERNASFVNDISSKPLTASSELLEQKQVKVSGSCSLHNLSYQIAIDKSVMHDCISDPCTELLGMKETNSVAVPGGESNVTGDQVLSSSLPQQNNFCGASVHTHRRLKSDCGQTSIMSTGIIMKQLADETKNQVQQRNNAISSSTDLLDWDCKNSDVTQDTCSSDLEIGTSFQREGFGRQSMSEKRKGHLDPRTTEVYQRIKQNKAKFSSVDDIKNQDFAKPSASARLIPSQQSAVEPRPAYSEVETGSNLVLKNSALVGCLHPAKDLEPNSESVKESDGQSRSCGTNNSFRAAIDRYYENNLETDEILLRYVDGSNPIDALTSNDKSLTSSEKSLALKDIKETHAVKKDKSQNRLKELLRFGKNKKSNCLNHQSPPGGTKDETKINDGKLQLQEKRASSAPGVRASSTKSSRRPISDCGSWESQSLTANQWRPDDEAERSTLPNPKDIQTSDGHEGKSTSRSILSKGQLMNQSDPTECQTAVAVEEQTNTIIPSSSRMLQLRKEHQRHHRERQCQYPLDAEEEAYEQRLRELEQQQSILKEKEHMDDLAVRHKIQYERPGNRNPYLERPASCGHQYQNIDVIRAQLHEHDNYQQRYHAEVMRHQQLQSANERRLPCAQHHHSHSYSGQSSGYYVGPNIADTGRSRCPFAIASAFTDNERGLYGNCEYIWSRTNFQQPQLLGRQPYIDHDPHEPSQSYPPHMGFERVFQGPPDRSFLWNPNGTSHYYSNCSSSFIQRPHGWHYYH